MIEMIKDAVSKLPIDADYSPIWTMFDRIMELHKEARMEGLLLLEEKVLLQLGIPQDSIDCDKYWEMYNELDGGDRFLFAMVRMLSSGYEAKELQEIAVSRYYSNGFIGVEALCACIATIGVLSIQAMEDSRVLKERVYAILPEEVEKACIQRELEKEDF